MSKALPVDVKSVFVYPCNSHIGKEICKYYAESGVTVTGGCPSGTLPPSNNDIVSSYYDEASDDWESARRQLLMISDAVIVEMLGYETSIYQIISVLLRLPFGGSEKVFVGISNPLAWAMTKPLPRPGPPDSDSNDMTAAAAAAAAAAA
eukprot:CAMPEP_0175046398 /NCGR_PEP_ID=MMETSP0052_2-20121109/5012_1 /TAXON_ID=51329 ORGANISM="Polytomella parva, Strain SAG 63-3" /NCGR_SAMPLE_ID=MMETSP0052_2 /ASSEMBLY_ACC=CAM_ASM_000194 /LENGTH=148 /DNA_ID=CAMNT_0016310147 /DNA_START=111 /DNA_END=553 /DNA_ORIENTATION=-